MLLSEFIDRTGYYPQEDEWEKINKDYMDSSYDKDTFCEIWLNNHKEEVAYQKKMSAIKNKIFAVDFLVKDPYRVKFSSEIVDWFKETYHPKGLSILKRALKDVEDMVYVTIIDNSIRVFNEYVPAKLAYYDNGKQEPIFEIIRYGSGYLIKVAARPDWYFQNK